MMGIWEKIKVGARTYQRIRSSKAAAAARKEEKLAASEIQMLKKAEEELRGLEGKTQQFAVAIEGISEHLNKGLSNNDALVKRILNFHLVTKAERLEDDILETIENVEKKLKEFEHAEIKLNAAEDGFERNITRLVEDNIIRAHGVSSIAGVHTETGLDPAEYGRELVKLKWRILNILKKIKKLDTDFQKYADELKAVAFRIKDDVKPLEVEIRQGAFDRADRVLERVEKNLRREEELVEKLRKILEELKKLESFYFKAEKWKVKDLQNLTGSLSSRYDFRTATMSGRMPTTGVRPTRGT
jgi:hypothetical protein